MCTLATVSINDDLAARKSCIAMWPAYHKLAGRVYVIIDLVVEQVLVVRIFLYDAGD